MDQTELGDIDQTERAVKSLSVEQRRIVGACLQAAVTGPYFPDGSSARYWA
jgi:hypothetical protein